MDILTGPVGIMAHQQFYQAGYPTYADDREFELENAAFQYTSAPNLQQHQFQQQQQDHQHQPRAQTQQQHPRELAISMAAAQIPLQYQGLNSSPIHLHPSASQSQPFQQPIQQPMHQEHLPPAQASSYLQQWPQANPESCYSFGNAPQIPPQQQFRTIQQSPPQSRTHYDHQTQPPQLHLQTQSTPPSASAHQRHYSQGHLASPVTFQSHSMIYPARHQPTQTALPLVHPGPFSSTTYSQPPQHTSLNSVTSSTVCAQQTSPQRAQRAASLTSSISSVPSPRTSTSTSRSNMPSNVTSAPSSSIGATVSRATSPSSAEMARWGRRNDEDGTWSCRYPGCASRSRFVRGCDLRKHYKRHSKTLFCRHEGCPQGMEGGFSSKKDRSRHEARHNPSVICEWDGCGRLFSRVDNMKDHVRRVHKRHIV